MLDLNSLGSPDRPRIGFPLPQLPKCWDYSQVPQFSAIQKKLVINTSHSCRYITDSLPATQLQYIVPTVPSVRTPLLLPQEHILHLLLHEPPLITPLKSRFSSTICPRRFRFSLSAYIFFNSVLQNSYNFC